MAKGDWERGLGEVVENILKDTGHDWLLPIIYDLFEDDRKYIPVNEIFIRPEVQKRKISKATLSKIIRRKCYIRTKTISEGGKKIRVYELPDENDMPRGADGRPFWSINRGGL